MTDKVFISTTSLSSNYYYLLDAAVGAGKTKTLLDLCGYGLIAGEKFIIASPTTDLADQSYRAFQQRFEDKRGVVIHSKNADNVASEIKRHSEQFSGTCAIFCTHSGLLQTPWLANKKGWHLIVDEMPQSVAHMTLTLKSDVESLVGRMVTARPLPNNPKYSALEVLSPDLRDIVASDPENGGVYSGDMHDLARKLQPKSWTLYVLSTQWKDAIVERKAGRELQVFAVLDHQAFAGFASATFASANIEHTLTYLHFTKTGAMFRRNRELERRLRYEVHPLGHKLDIYYGIAQKWSKRKRKIMVDGITLNDQLAQAAMNLFGDEPFAKLVNKDLAQGRDPFGSNGTELPHASYGRNDFQHLNNCAILPALNPTPAYDAFLQEIVGLDADQVHRAIYLEQIHQAAARISLRNIDDTTSMRKVVVADVAAGNFLNSMYPNSSLHRLLDVELTTKTTGRPQTRTEGEKVEQKRQADRRHNWREKHSRTKVPKEYTGFRTCKSLSNEENRGYIISLWESHAAKPRPYEFFELQHHKHLISQKAYSPADFNEYLRNCATRLYGQKYENDLIITSYFDLKQDPDHGHSKSNHAFSQGVMLDFEGQHEQGDDPSTWYDFTPDEVHGILGYEMTIYASWSHTPEAQRFRVCIPTLIMNYDQQECVRRCLVRKLEQAQPNKRINVDESKLNPVSLMYLPCDRPDNFITEYQGNALDHEAIAKTCPKDIVDKVLSLSPHTIPEERPYSPVRDSPVDQTPFASGQLATGFSEAPYTPPASQAAVIARAIEVWRTRGCLRGKGLRYLWSLATTLMERTNLERHEIYDLLWEEAGYATNPSERRDEINGLLKDCR